MPIPPKHPNDPPEDRAPLRTADAAHQITRGSRPERAESDSMKELFEDDLRYMEGPDA